MLLVCKLEIVGQQHADQVRNKASEIEWLVFFIQKGHGSRPVCTVKSYRFGTTKCVLWSTSLTSMMEQFLVFVFTVNCPCLSLALMTIKSGYGITCIDFDVRGHKSTLFALTLFTTRISNRNSWQCSCLRLNWHRRRLTAKYSRYSAGQFLCSRRHSSCSSTLLRDSHNWRLDLSCNHFATRSGWSRMFSADRITTRRDDFFLESCVVGCCDMCSSIRSHCFGLGSLDSCLCCS